MQNLTEEDWKNIHELAAILADPKHNKKLLETALVAMRDFIKSKELLQLKKPIQQEPVKRETPKWLRELLDSKLQSIKESEERIKELQKYRGVFGITTST